MFSKSVMVYNHIISIVSNQRLGYVLLLVLFVFTNVACTQKKGITDDCSEKLATMAIDTLLTDTTFMKECKPVLDTTRLGNHIRPLPPAYTLDKLPDTVVRVDFDYKDFDWELDRKSVV